MDEIAAEKTAQVNAYSTNIKVRAGYAAGYQAELDDIFPSAIGQAEILLSNTGTYGAYGDDIKTISIQAAIQHPLSRGSVLINSTSAFDAPLIDPGYLTHPADIKILIKAFQYARYVQKRF
jgi:choline dehydrogenase